MDSACVTCSTPAWFSFVVARPLSTSRLEKSGARFGEHHFFYCRANPLLRCSKRAGATDPGPFVFSSG